MARPTDRSHPLDVSIADRPARLLGALRLIGGRQFEFGPTAAVLLLLAVPLVGVPIVLAALGIGGHGQLWERLHLTLAATLGLVIATAGRQRGRGRTRAVRGWIATAFAAWLVAELLRDLERTGLVQPIPTDLALAFVAVAVIGAYRAGIHGRFSRSAERSLYVDAAIVCVAVAAILLTFVGLRSLDVPGQLSLLLHSLLFMSVFAATALLELAVLTPRTVRGGYAILLGLAVVWFGFIGQRELGGALGIWPFASLVSIGVLITAFGGATWTDDEDHDPGYSRRARRIRDLIPLAAVAAVPLVLLPAQVVIADVTLRILINGSIAIIVVGAVVRQRLLAGDRDGVLEGLRRALDSVEQRARQLAGIEGAGRHAALSGASPQALDAVAAILAEQFGYDHVGIHLGDAGSLRMVAQRGLVELEPGLDGATGIVGRVIRRRRPELVADVALDPDYVVGDPAVRSEICVPLLHEGRLLGVLDVQTSAERRLDETDLAAVLAVADRVASGVALDRQRQQLVDEKDFIGAILEAVGAVVIVLDADGRLARYNSAVSVVSGYSPAEIDAVGTLDHLIPAEERSEVLAAVARLQTGKAMDRRENAWLHKDGTRRHLAWSNTAVRDATGAVRYTIATGIDITERKALEDELTRKSLHDPLTGLPNRQLLMDRLEHALRQRRTTNPCLLTLDVDHIQMINDNHGHEVGDRVLKVAAERIVRAVRPGDTVARLGGDEFAVVLEGIATEDTSDIVAARILEAIATPIDIGAIQVAITACIGTASTGSHASSAGELLRDADFAMQTAKRQGPGRFRRYEPGDRASADDDARLAADLAGSAGRGELRVDYQPIVDLRSGAIEGVEALVRWQHPERGLLAPGTFIPIAERTGSIVEIGALVLDAACGALKGWHADLPGLTMAVNISGRQLESPELLDQVRRALRRSAIDPATLVLEVTETILLGDPSAVAKLEALKTLGVRLGIDDFGTGYSSISYLRRFPVDVLKIDREFIDAADTPQGLRLLRGIAQLGHVIGLELVAEGIERIEQIAPILEAGCKHGQGFLFSRPVEADGMSALLRAGRLGPSMPASLAPGSAPGEMDPKPGGIAPRLA